MPHRSKRYQEAFKQVDRMKEYPLEEAVQLAQSLAKAKFDETMELHFRLGIDPRQSDQQVRSTVLLPHGLGKKVRIIVFAEGEDAKYAQDANADYVGGEELITRIQKDGWLEFDAAIATQSMMAKVSRVARVLGPRGLMPNVKAGTVVPGEQLPRVIDELRAGRVEFRNDKTGNLHMPIGKVSFETQRLIENARTAISAVQAQKPSAAKGVYIKRTTLTTTMGPGLKVTLTV
jgi:large subunit ribosomal protein L1